MNELVSLIPLRPGDIALAAPLPYSIYDWHGKLLAQQGTVIGNADQLDKLSATGFYHDPTLDLDFSPPRVSAMKTESPAAHPAAEEIVMAMDEIHWYVGETLYLQLPDNPAMRYTVKLIGFVKNKSVLITAPAVDGKYEFIRDGQSFVIRAFSGKKAYAFIADAMKSVHAPHPYMHLSYPKQVRCTVVRQGVRASVRIIASISIGMPERVGAATITDLSMGGASAMLGESMGKGGDTGRIKFKVNVAGQDEYLNLQIVLRSVSEAAGGEGVRHGMEFADLAPREKILLSAFVHQTFVDSQ